MVVIPPFPHKAATFACVGQEGYPCTVDPPPVKWTEKKQKYSMK